MEILMEKGREQNPRDLHGEAIDQIILAAQTYDAANCGAAVVLGYERQQDEGLARAGPHLDQHHTAANGANCTMNAVASDAPHEPVAECGSARPRMVSQSQLTVAITSQTGTRQKFVIMHR